ncbi:NUDIX hydrolase [Paenibacillus bovis]|uniref:DNA mismatch repair protein MutT n=1 Tax=Paenibacillus bovis TaxID=1616788 RepID=A0A172ZHH4_9BACL|nr:NUDIX domain-containing protein [Paenibacillus bovis]ANF96979.1 DNA mismatch repair protein MutT [Paenibacillus bovis]
MTTIIDKIAWIHIQDQRILCARSKGKALYYIPGGKRETGESDEETLIREVEEELSVRIHPASVSSFGVFEAAADSKSADTVVRMSCYTGEYEGTIQPASEIETTAWLGYKDIEQVSAATRLIMEDLHKRGLIV